MKEAFALPAFLLAIVLVAGGCKWGDRLEDVEEELVHVNERLDTNDQQWGVQLRVNDRVLAQLERQASPPGTMAGASPRQDYSAPVGQVPDGMQAPGGAGMYAPAPPPPSPGGAMVVLDIRQPDGTTTRQFATAYSAYATAPGGAPAAPSAPAQPPAAPPGPSLEEIREVFTDGNKPVVDALHDLTGAVQGLRDELQEERRTPCPHQTPAPTLVDPNALVVPGTTTYVCPGYGRAVALGCNGYCYPETRYALTANSTGAYLYSDRFHTRPHYIR